MNKPRPFVQLYFCNDDGAGRRLKLKKKGSTEASLNPFELN
jgi:hypothetical protein